MKFLSEGLGRIIFGLPFIVFGVLHFMNASAMVNIVPAWVPIPMFFVYFTGVALVAAGVFIAGRIKFAGLASFLLAVMLLIFILTIHLPGVMDKETIQASMPSLLKDTALMGAALTYSGLLATKKETKSS